MPEKSARERRLEAERDALKTELERAWQDLDYARLERDSARRRLDDAWDAMARAAASRIEARLAEAQAQQQGLAGESVRVVDCTGGGRASYLGLIGGA